MDLVRKYRPSNFDDVVGQESIVSSVRSIGLSKFSGGSFLFYGDSGTGKTTMARLVALSLNCSSLSSSGNPCGICKYCEQIIAGIFPDIIEVNAAKNRGIDDIRRLDEQLPFSSIYGKFKVLILDEAHALTKDAQNSMLKLLEDVPSNVCVILCSTEPNKILSTVRNRCKGYKFKLVDKDGIYSLLDRVCSSEGFLVTKPLISKIASSAEGKPRNALIKLDQVMSSDRTETVVNDILAYDVDTPAQIIELCRMLASKSNVWGDIVKTYKSVSSFDPSLIAVAVAGYFRVMLENSKSYASSIKVCKVLDLFVSPLPYIKPENMLVLNLYKAYIIMRERDNNMFK